MDTGPTARGSVRRKHGAQSVMGRTHGAHARGMGRMHGMHTRGMGRTHGMHARGMGRTGHGAHTRGMGRTHGAWGARTGRTYEMHAWDTRMGRTHGTHARGALPQSPRPRVRVRVRVRAVRGEWIVTRDIRSCTGVYHPRRRKKYASRMLHATCPGLCIGTCCTPFLVSRLHP